MKGSGVLFSHGKDDWQTPTKVFQPLHDEFHFSVDAAANADNHLLPEWYGPGSRVKDALLAVWDAKKVYWCNPPYSRVAEFVAKGAVAADDGVTSVWLIPARTDTRWWHTWIWDAVHHRPSPPGVEVRFLKGRVRFLDGTGEDSYINARGKRVRKGGAPFPSAIVVFRPV